ncbi:hypothetical protein B296_00053287 [Ensete ventricosum]|uniref:Uncharacterized protein n=1 Tax=Ensete ventricosum TaxID=4639 RepID=A0A426WY62_ENSVE|nr:hypothetical protein B296_00053287 [Ensete ventricosum]
MHPLRFPNSGIRAKRRKTLQGAAAHGHDQPPYSGGRPPARGRSIAARSPVRGGHPQGHQPCGHDRLRPGRRACCPLRDSKRQSPATRPQVAAAHCKAARGSPATAGRSDRQPSRCRPKAAAPTAGAAAHADGVQRRHLRRAVTAITTQMGARRGLGHPFK